jgi:hypothetical protein
MRFTSGATAACTTTTIVVMLLTLTSSVKGEGTSANVNDNDNDNKDGFECGIYLAPSSIPNAGFGIYTTRSIEQDESVQPYPDAPSIPVTNFYEPYQYNQETDWNHFDYVWEPSGPAAFEADSVSESVMTFGSLCNFHPLLKNLSPDASAYDDTILNRFKNPGAGAISYHVGRYFKASRDIEAGEELFDDYGENWLDSRPGGYADLVPREEDYDKGASIMKKLNRKNTSFEDNELSMIAKTVSIFSDRAASLIPKTKVEYENFITTVSKSTSAGKITNVKLSHLLARSFLLPRDVDWIKTNGMCIEKIKPGPSTIAEAGRGAFAQVDIQIGDIIAPAPLLNIPNKKSLVVYKTEFDSEGNRVKVDGDEPVGHQLIMNYCFGHKESDLILCPQTNAILINHCSDREEGGHRCRDGKGPNAKVQWASGWDPTSDEWLTKSIEEITTLTTAGSRGLSLEIVATTNIAPGEEIFIDYGENWEKAWNTHVNNWTSTPNASQYSPVKEMIAKGDFRTLNELGNNPYPKNINMFCYGGAVMDDYDLDDYEEDELVRVDGRTGFAASKDDLDEPEYILPCKIQYKDEKTGNYTMQIKHGGVRFLVKNFPKKSVILMFKPYTSDQHLEGAFRHFIEISDDIFPKQWKTSSE